MNAPTRITQDPSITPEGYARNAKGHLVPVDMIKPIDLERDVLVRELFDQAKAVSDALVRFKGRAFGDIQAFIELSAERYGTKVGGQKGNVSLMSFCGRYMIKRAINDTLRFDEGLQAAKALIDECLAEWTQGAKPEAVALINDAFNTDSAGNINTARVLGLRRLDIHDPRWLKAMSAISDAVQVVGSRSYIRVYERVGDNDQWRQIPLDIASA